MSYLSTVCILPVSWWCLPVYRLYVTYQMGVSNCLLSISHQSAGDVIPVYCLYLTSQQVMSYLSTECISTISWWCLNCLLSVYHQSAGGVLPVYCLSLIGKLVEHHLSTVYISPVSCLLSYLSSVHLSHVNSW